MGGGGRALTIAGSDSGGGAGIQADLKTFVAFGVHGMCAVTAVTAQNTEEVRAAAAMLPDLVVAQIEAVRDDIGVDAVKSGMLADASIVRAVGATLRRGDLGPFVLDPVMRSKSGAPLLEPAACAALREELLPLATVLTPNLPEAAALLGCDERELSGMDALRQAAAALHRLGPRHVLLKGGHVAPGAGAPDAVDLWFDGQTWRELSAPRVATRNTHGTGCTLSAALCACLARGLPLASAMAAAKEFVTWAIAHAPGLGRGSGPLNHLHPVYPPLWAERP
jgi:hydroxymethylpyrimidine/phosphomethylpyrimidine kinase